MTSLIVLKATDSVKSNCEAIVKEPKAYLKEYVTLNLQNTMVVIFPRVPQLPQIFPTPCLGKMCIWHAAEECLSGS